MKKILLVSTLVLSILFAGCVPAVSTGAPEVEVSSETPRPARSEKPAKTVKQRPAKPQKQAPAPTDNMADVDQLFKRAREASAAGRHGLADSLFVQAAAVMLHNSAKSSGSEERDERTRRALQNYIEEMLSIYNEQMPQGFATPEDISKMVYSLHIWEDLLDKLKDAPKDDPFPGYMKSLNDKRGKTQYDIPVVINDRVIQSLRFHTRMNKTRYDRWLEPAAFYLPIMRKMFADAGLPQDLAYLPIIESSFNPQATSRVGAAGIWQFMPATGKHYNLRQDKIAGIDERRDPIKSTEAAIKYLNKLHKQFGDWYIALASYNCGEGRMAQVIKKAGISNDYWQLSLPQETMGYVPIFLSAVIIAKNPDVFGFTPLEKRKGFDLDTVRIHECLSLAAVAKGINVPFDILKSMNPHILFESTPPDMKNVLLYLPSGYASVFNEYYKNLSHEDKRRMEAEARKSIAARKVMSAAPVAARQGTKKVTHTVSRGESLYSISQKYNVTVSNLQEWNKLKKPGDIRIGQKLTVHVKDASPAKAATAAASPAAPATAAPQQAQAVTGKHTVAQGETMYSIARKLGVPLEDLARMNDMDPKRPRTILPGDVLVYNVPTATAAATPAASVSETSATPQPPSSPSPPIADTTKTAPKIIVHDGFIEEDITPDPIAPAQPPTAQTATSAVSPPAVPAAQPIVSAPSPPPAQQPAQPPISAAPVQQPAPQVQAPAASVSGIRVVRAGETLYSISRELGVPLNELAAINGLNAERPMIKPGDTLRFTPPVGQQPASQTAVPQTPVAPQQPTASPPPPQSSQSPAPQAGQTGAGVATPQQNVQGSALPPKTRYTVKQGDTLWSISTAFGTTVQAIRDENGLTPESVIKVGMELVIP